MEALINFKFQNGQITFNICSDVDDSHPFAGLNELQENRDPYLPENIVDDWNDWDVDEGNVEKLGETTNYDINMIEVDAIQKVYDKYNLPALFNEGEGDFYQGDATNEEVIEAARNINNMLWSDDIPGPEIDVFYNEGHEYRSEEGELNAEELYSFLKKEFLKEYELTAMNVVKAHWIEYYTDDIEQFLQENYYTEGGEIGHDYSVYINIETGKIWEHIAASSNWSFMNYDGNRKRIVHLNNYDKPFLDWADLVAGESDDVIAQNLGCELPKDWRDLDYSEKIDWVIKNVSQDILDEYNGFQIEEAINRIMENIKDDPFNEDIDSLL